MDMGSAQRIDEVPGHEDMRRGNIAAEGAVAGDNMGRGDCRMQHHAAVLAGTRAPRTELEEDSEGASARVEGDRDWAAAGVVAEVAAGAAAAAAAAAVVAVAAAVVAVAVAAAAVAVAAAVAAAATAPLAAPAPALAEDVLCRGEGLELQATKQPWAHG